MPSAVAACCNVVTVRPGYPADGLDHPRWLYLLPNGDILVAETNVPARPKGKFSLRGFVMGWVMARAGATVPSPDRITLLHDRDGDRVAEQHTAFLTGLHSPFGMALVGNVLYVADTDAILAFPYQSGDTAITTAGRKVTDLPAGPINHHWTKDLLASPDGGRLYVGVGSNSNAGENGLADEGTRTLSGGFILCLSDAKAHSCTL